MIHIKKFNEDFNYQELIQFICSFGATYCIIKFIEGLINSLQDPKTIMLKNLSKKIKNRSGKSCIKLVEDIVYYTITFEYKEVHSELGLKTDIDASRLIIKINKNNSTIKWKMGHEKDFCEPIKIKNYEIKELIENLEEDIKNKQ